MELFYIKGNTQLGFYYMFKENKAWQFRRHLTSAAYPLSKKKMKQRTIRFVYEWP